MTKFDDMVEQHILEYEARLKHMNEMMARAEQSIHSSPQAETLGDELENLEKERSRLLSHIDQIKQKTRAEWQVETIEEAGPMIVWEAVAKQLESLVERLGR